MRRILQQGYLAAPILAVGILALVSPSPSWATTLRQMDLAELTGRADTVAAVRCRDTRTYFGGKNGRKILTDYIFSVTGVAKGAPGRTLTLTLMGGRIDPVQMTVPGAPTFLPGDEAVLFTAGGDSGRRVLVGFTQGVIPVLIHPETGEKFVSSRVFRDTGRGGPGAAAPEGKIGLEEFLDTVRAIRDDPPAGRTRPITPTRGKPE